MRADDLTAELVVRAYVVGAFPMADSRTQQIHWYRPDPRAILPLDDRFHIRRSLRRQVRSGRFTITRDRVFETVIRACAEPRPGRETSWINESIIRVYTELHALGLGHSVEAWHQSPEDAAPVLAGGLYGVALGGAFFGESMFSRMSNGSQVCLVHLVEHLRNRGFTLLDVQFHNPHLEQFGLIEIPSDDYLRQLDEALRLNVRW